MGTKYYLRIQEEKFGFVVEGIHEIKENDISITQEEYDKFFELQSQGKQFRVIEGWDVEIYDDPDTIFSKGLFDYIEEYTPEPLPPGPPTEMELLQEEVMLQAENQIDLDFRVTSLELGL